jgi:hypothetical protein
VDSLGAGAWEIGRPIVPDREQRRQEAPKRSLATLTWFLTFWRMFLVWRGCPDPFYPFHTTS